MTTFFPLTLSGGPFFYYIRFPDKKGTLSVEGGETTVGSVIEGFYPPSTREPIYYLDPNEVTKLCPFVVETTQVEESGNAEWTYVPYLICQVPPDFYTMINKSISSPHNISGRYDIPHYRLYNRYSILSSN
jgi:hypothetical protein